MTNAFRGLIVLLAVGFLINSCRADREVSEYLAEEIVILDEENGWQLTITDDGAGTLQCQGFRYGQAYWPAATFPFGQIRWLPPFSPREQEQFPFFWTYYHHLTEDHQRYGLPDTVWAGAWFEAAYRQLDRTATPAPRRLLRQWEQEPPVGVRQ
ncbi:MAG: hypothetical protein AAGJ82_06490 [Bacteroidota bacterium]